MKTPEQILMQPKYKELSKLVLICEAMEEFADQQIANALFKMQKVEEENERLKEENKELKKLMIW